MPPQTKHVNDRVIDLSGWITCSEDGVECLEVMATCCDHSTRIIVNVQGQSFEHRSKGRAHHQLGHVNVTKKCKLHVGIHNLLNNSLQTLVFGPNVECLIHICDVLQLLGHPI